MKISIDYDGCYPCLCCGHLVVKIDDKVFDFGEGSLSSGGHVEFDEHWSEKVVYGAWKWGIEDEDFPKDFPLDLKDDVLRVINDEVEYGCCGGCV